ncbi:hypothetical protein C8T65DRAFT_745094 [Cerioporus squamosus]|nr:hypothetical protein C8T65DRAFT_745094 [Cerioporus squamosus]
MTDHGTSVVKREKTAETLDSLPAPQSSSRLPLTVLDTIICYAVATGTFDIEEYKTNNRTLLACALTCRAMLRPAQTHLFFFFFKSFYCPVRA